MRSDFHNLPHAAQMAIREGERSASQARSAANDIARLKAENAACREHERMANAKALQLLARNDEVESALARSQALIDEMAEGMAEFLRRFPVRVNEGDLQFCQNMEALIAKARGDA